MILHQAFCFVTVYLYNKYSDATDVDTGPDETIAQLPVFKIVCGLFVVSMLSFVLFLRSINRKYLVTFFDTKTGFQFLCENWRSATSDKERFYIFSKNKYLYTSINEELKEWLSLNWDRWTDEAEDWFNKKIIDKIPPDLLPDNARVLTVKEGEETKIRKEVVGNRIAPEG